MNVRLPSTPFVLLDDARAGSTNPARLYRDARLYPIGGGTREIKVNSIHGQGVDRLAEGLEVEALAPDGVVEAVRVKASTFAVSVQWHPEWRWWEDPVSTALFRAFGDAALDRVVLNLEDLLLVDCFLVHGKVLHVLERDEEQDPAEVAEHASAPCAQTGPKISDALVPPKPNELLSA